LTNTRTPDLARLQRDSADLADIIRFLENGSLPADLRAAQVITHDADNWFLDPDGTLHRIYNPRKRNVNSVKHD